VIVTVAAPTNAKWRVIRRHGQTAGIERQVNILRGGQHMASIGSV
jgi:hypothetical protein